MEPYSSDEQLLTRSADDPAAFEELYRRQIPRVTAFAVRRCGSPHEVSDLVAAVWLEVIESATSFDPTRGKALPWILGVAANLAASDARRQSRERDALARLAGRRVLEDDDFARLEAEIDAHRVSGHIRRALSQLPPAERAVAELVLLDDLSPRDAAFALGLRQSTARMRLRRARTKLRRSIPSFRLAMKTHQDVIAQEVSR